MPETVSPMPLPISERVSRKVIGPILAKIIIIDLKNQVAFILIINKKIAEDPGISFFL